MPPPTTATRFMPPTLALRRPARSSTSASSLSIAVRPNAQTRARRPRWRATTSRSYSTSRWSAVNPCGHTSTPSTSAARGQRLEHLADVGAPPRFGCPPRRLPADRPSVVCRDRSVAAMPPAEASQLVDVHVSLEHTLGQRVRGEDDVRPRWHRRERGPHARSPGRRATPEGRATIERPSRPSRAARRTRRSSRGCRAARARRRRSRSRRLSSQRRRPRPR